MMKIGLHKAQKLTGDQISGTFYRSAIHPTKHINYEIKGLSLQLFGWFDCDLSEGFADWNRNPFNKSQNLPTNIPWWKIKDFSNIDIKTIWELSRFDWVVILAYKAQTCDHEKDRLNRLVNSWCKVNQPFLGPNWKCGQEASIRVIHLIYGAWILGSDKRPSTALLALIKCHLERIESTISYAIAQNNNHGVSEAVALYVGGGFLLSSDPFAKRYLQVGKKLLNKLAKTLILSDGTFSQYSTNYHRLMIDAFSFAEAWRRKKRLQAV